MSQRLNVFQVAPAAIEALLGDTPLLRKPFDVHALSVAVAEILRS